jgi:hypothetical protein
LFFTDDSLLFYKANIFEWMHIQEVLRISESASRQKLNKDKTSFFSIEIPRQRLVVPNLVLTIARTVVCIAFVQVPRLNHKEPCVV